MSNPQDFAPQARAFLSNTAMPALERAKAQIIDAMVGREGEVTPEIGGAAGGSVRLAISRHGAETDEYSATVIAKARTLDVNVRLRTMPTLGRALEQPLDSDMTVQALADRVYINYVDTMDRLRKSGSG